MMTLAEYVRSTPFFVIAHRGASGDAPENTMAAIRMAIEGGAAMVEIDVQTTLDKELVVFHDKVLGRTTNGHGHIRQFSMQDLAALDAGSWFDDAFAGEKVPRLSEALELVGNRCYINIELKPLTDLEDAVDHVTALINELRSKELIPFSLLSSFDHDALKLAKTIEPSIHTAALNVPGDSRLPSEIVSLCQADGFGCSTHEMTKKRSNDLLAHGIPWGVYSVDTIEDLHRAIDLRVSAVVTKHPAMIRDAYSSVAK